jgi:hypothetical protein
MSYKVRQVTSGQVKPCAVWPHWPGVANDVFNGVRTPDLVAYLIVLGQQCGVVPLCRWSL